MLTYNLNNRGETPLYDYIYQCIRQDIISGKLAPGEKLPSKRTLSRHLNVGIITVSNAYSQLLTEGFIFSIERKGYFVRNVQSLQKQPEAADETEPYPEETPEKEYFADFKANRTGITHFPVSTWNHFMREALSQQDGNLLKTIPFNGLFELRRAISNYLRENRGMVVSPGQIIIGAGTEYLYGRLMQMFGRACTFAIENPGYKKFGAISASFGNPWKYVPIDENGLVIEALEDSEADVVHVSPANHFPTGIVMPITRRIELFEWVNRAKKRYIIEDDYDSEFRYSGKFIPPMFAEDSNDKVIYINTFSKSMVPSLRISYMILPKQLMNKFEETMSFYSCTVSSFEQYALAKFISEGYFERHINRMKNYYKEQRKLIFSEIENSPLRQISEIQERNAGTHFLLKIKTTLNENQVREAGLASDMLLSLYSDYGFENQEEGSCTLVINYAAISREKIPAVIDRLSNIFIK